MKVFPRKNKTSGEKICWILTHDQQIDRRIIAYVTPLRELGFEPILFAGPGVIENTNGAQLVRPLPVSFRKRLALALVRKSKMIPGVLSVLRITMEEKIQQLIQKILLFHYKTAEHIVSIKLRKLYRNRYINWLRIFSSLIHQSWKKISLESSKIQEIIDSSPAPVTKSPSNNNWQKMYLDFKNVVYDFSLIYQCMENALATGKVLPNPTLIIVNDLPTLPLGFHYSRLYNVPLIVDCHEWWLEQSRLFLEERKEHQKQSDRWEKLLYPRCDSRITVGHKLAEKMTDYFDCPFHVVYSSLDPVSFGQSTDRVKLLHKFSLPTNSQIILFQGSLTRLRNIETLISAVGYFTEEQYLVILGDGPHRQTLEELAKQLGLLPKIRFAGWIGGDQLLDYTKNADLAVLPYVSVNDYYSVSCPNKLFEYIAAGLPFIHDPSMQEISMIAEKSGLGISCDCHSAQVLGEHIAAFSGNKNPCIEKRNLAKSEEYYWSYQRESFKKVVLDVCEEPIS